MLVLLQIPSATGALVAVVISMDEKFSPPFFDDLVLSDDPYARRHLLLLMISGPDHLPGVC